MLVVGVEDEHQIQGVLDLPGDDVLLVGEGEHHMEEVRAVAQMRIGVDEGQAPRPPIGERRDGADLADEPGRRFDEGFRILQGHELRVEAGQVAQGGRKDGHGRCIDGNMLVLMLEPFVQEFVFCQAGAKVLQLSMTREVAEDQQIGHFHEVRLLGELLDGDAAIAKDAALAVDVSNRAAADGGVTQRRIEGDQTRLVAEPRDVDAAFSFDAPDQGQFHPPIAYDEDGLVAHG